MKSSVAKSLAMSVVSMGLLHCGGEPAVTPDGGIPDGGVVMMGNDVPSVADTGVIPDSGTPLIGAKTGLITIVGTSTQVGMMMVSTSTASATFPDSTGIVGGCTTQTMGPCEVVTCVGGAMSRLARAGNITISGATGGPVMLLPNGMNNSYNFAEAAERFPVGATLTVNATGNPVDVPAFTAMVTMPGALGLTAPVIPLGGMFMLPRAMPLVLTWAGGVSGSAQFFLSAPGTAPKITCRFPAMAATGTIPASVLMMMPAGNGTYAFTSSNRTDVVAGDYSVSIYADRLTGTAAGRVVFQ